MMVDVDTMGHRDPPFWRPRASLAPSSVFPLLRYDSRERILDLRDGARLGIAEFGT